jgi:hypothetical protein
MPFICRNYKLLTILISAKPFEPIRRKRGIPAMAARSTMREKHDFAALSVRLVS